MAGLARRPDCLPGRPTALGDVMPAHALGSTIVAAGGGGHHFGIGFLILIVCVIGGLSYGIVRMRNRNGAHGRDGLDQAQLETWLMQHPQQEAAVF